MSIHKRSGTLINISGNMTMSEFLLIEKVANQNP